MKVPRLVAADSMARVVSGDRQFQLPVRPRFAAEFVTVPLPDGLLIEGAEERQILRGRSALDLVPRFIGQLDGTLTFEGLCKANPDIPPEHLTAVLSLLYTRGLLEDASADDDHSGVAVHPQVLSFFRRHVDCTRMNRSALQAARRLAESSVLIVADDPFCASQMADELRMAGVGSVTVTTSLIDQTLSEATTVVALAAGKEPPWMERIDELCKTRSLPWVRLAINGVVAQFGPAFFPGEQRCYRCFSRCHELEGCTFQETPSWAKRAWIGLAATEVLYLLSWIVDLRAVNEVHIFDLEEWAGRRCSFGRIPGCPNCLPDTAPAETIPAALAYEESVDLPAKHLMSLKAHQTHYKVANGILQRVSKHYPNARLIALPPVEVLPPLSGDLLSQRSREETAVEANAVLERDHLAAILTHTVGIRGQMPDGRPQRWAYNGGNLGSVGAYAIVRTIPTMRPALYYYLPEEHGLAILTEWGLAADAEAAMREVAVLPDEEPPDALIFLTGAYQRMAAKYYAMAYRLIMLDAGVALAQAQAVASAVCMEAVPLTRWDDEKAHRLLGVDGQGEMVTGVLAVHGRRRLHESPL